METSGKNWPEYCWGSVDGPNVVNISNEEMDQLIANGIVSVELSSDPYADAEAKDGKLYYTRIEWKATYAKSAGSFITHTLPALKKIADEELNGDYSKLRVVFWFDS